MGGYKLSQQKLPITAVYFGYFSLYSPILWSGASVTLISWTCSTWPTQSASNFAWK